MDPRDHDYTSTTYYNVSPAENTYKMTSKETEDFVKLRISNDYLFSGKRNTTMAAWRAILKQMGLQHKMTHRQASKKWENLRKKYKELRNPPDGVTVFPQMWRHFRLMDDAILRLEGSASVVNGLPDNQDKGDLSLSKSKKRRLSTLFPTTSVEEEPEIEVTLSGDDEEAVQDRSQAMNCIIQEVEDERNVIESDKRVIKREKGLIEREQLVLQRERAVLDREAATLERDRASLEREKVTFEREKEVLEKERMMVEKDREELRRERQALDREKARLERLFISKDITEEVTEHGSKDAHVVDMNRKERFLYLFEKLVEDF